MCRRENCVPTPSEKKDGGGACMCEVSRSKEKRKRNLHTWAFFGRQMFRGVHQDKKNKEKYLLERKRK